MSHDPTDSLPANGSRFSPCRKYRYRLWRTLTRGEGMLLWIMHNPSTADESTDDPTIRRCCGFAERWVFGRIDVVDLFAWRTADPHSLDLVIDPVGIETRRHTATAIHVATRIVCAWGDLATSNTRTLRNREIRWLQQALGHRQAYCIGTTKKGQPYHPARKLYTLMCRDYRISEERPSAN